MAGYKDVSVFERGVAVDALEMGHITSPRSRRPTRVPLLTARHKALRLAWVRQHRHWTVDDWKHVAWSDESRFQLNRADGGVGVWRKHYESMDPACQQGSNWIQAHYEQLSEFERGCIIGLKEASWTNRRIARHMNRSDAAIRK
ncbi:uncharacterized protein TNCV_5063691 [Trichonephila clavipes]|nr:uncharacterized protein TNCV_5063691 [Trichonephila clavipes]